MTSIEKNVVETAKNVEKIKKEVVKEVVNELKPVVTQPTEPENSIDNVKADSYESVKNEPKIIYAKPLGNGNLKTTSEASEAIYVILMNNDNTGKFSLYENENQKKRAIKNKDNMLDLFCDVTGSSIGAETIKNLKEGEVQLVGNGFWKVTRKAKIGFIK